MKRSVYTRPNKPLFIPATRRDDPPPLEKLETPEIVTVDRATECHATPDDVAALMVDYLGPVGDFHTLEPSAGTGQLTRALLASGHSPRELCQIERHNTLARHLRQLGPVVNACFLEWTEENQRRASFPRIIMNPPFSKVRAHIKAALSLLDRGGHIEPACMVALVPITFDHPDAETLEELQPGTFPTAPNVRTKIIRFQR